MKADVQSPDTRPLLLGRFDCPAERIDEIDAWIPKHLDDSLAHPGLTSAAYFTVMRGLPAVFTGAGNRIVIYVAETVSGMLEWMDSPELTEAVEDSGGREEEFYPLDGESPGTANIYEPVEIRHPLGDDFVGQGSTIMIERFEVETRDADQFDTWLVEHLEQVSSWPHVARARAFKAKRDTPDRYPYNRYRSIGNRAVLVEFSTGVDPTSLFTDARVTQALIDSIRWDLHLPYARREVGECTLLQAEES